MPADPCDRVVGHELMCTVPRPQVDHVSGLLGQGWSVPTTDEEGMLVRVRPLSAREVKGQQMLGDGLEVAVDIFEIRVPVRVARDLNPIHPGILASASDEKFTYGRNQGQGRVDPHAESISFVRQAKSLWVSPINPSAI